MSEENEKWNLRSKENQEFIESFGIEGKEYLLKCKEKFYIGIDLYMDSIKFVHKDCFCFSANIKIMRNNPNVPCWFSISNLKGYTTSTTSDIITDFKLILDFIANLYDLKKK